MADPNGSRHPALEVALGAALAVNEQVWGLTAGVLQQVFDPAGWAVDQAQGALEGAWEGYQENGLLGAVNSANPVYALLVSQHQAREAAEEGEHVAAGYHGTVAVITAASLLGMARGAGAGRGVSARGARPWHFHGSRPSLLANLELVQSIATRAERRIGGSGWRAGVKKHVYAKRLLVRYQDMFGSRGLRAEATWLHGKPDDYGVKGSVRFDVFDGPNRLAYDYKFAKKKPALHLSQIDRLFKSGPTSLLMIIEINP